MKPTKDFHITKASIEDLYKHPFYELGLCKKENHNTILELWLKKTYKHNIASIEMVSMIHG